jgi:hypothetical protein
MSGTKPIQQLPEIHYSHPTIDEDRAGRELVKHLEMLGLSPVRVRWMPDAEEGYLRAERGPGNSDWRRRLRVAEIDESAAGSSARYLTRAALLPVAWRPFEDRARLAVQDGVWRRILKRDLPTAWTAAGGAVRALGYRAALGSARSRLERVIHEHGLGLWAPLLEAYGAGLWLYWVLHQEVVAVARPALRTVDAMLHAPDGPAVAWTGGARYYFWRGMEVPARLIMEPEELRAREIVGERNRELQRVMLERFGYDRFILELAAVPVQADGFGTLYRIHMGQYRESLALVHVTNSTPELDGSRKRYFLRVPPNVRTAHEAVAWTFGLRPEEYSPAEET